MNADDIVPLFLSACPGLKNPWDEYLEKNRDREERLRFIEMAVIARYIVHCLKSGDEGSVSGAFMVVERCLAEGDDQVRQLVIVGVLEDIQTLSGWEDVDLRAYDSYLGDKARGAWEELRQAWMGVSGLADMVRKERGGKR